MRKLLLIAGLLWVQCLPAQTKDYPFQSVSFTSVQLSDSFWLPRIRTNHAVTIPASFERCESTGRIKNFIMAAKKEGKFCTRYPFDDTDIYKTIEGAAFSLSLFPDKKMELYIDSLIDIVGKAQEPDGYLYTARTIDPVNVHPWLGKERWEKEREHSHELYNAGHLYEAAAAHYLATGKKNLLNIALKNADLVCSVFGPDKRHVAPGHQVIEMGLVKLYRITGKREYLETAKFFIEERGRFNGYDPKSNDPFKNGSYWQDHIPVVKQREAIGHAVRAGYLYAAVADVAALTGDQQLLQAIDSIWINMVSKKIYIQGGAGAIDNGERYGNNYELPNETAYNETCAAIANVFWNHRMFLLHGESKYMDLLEKILYNNVLSGIGLDGKSFFYTNALQITNYHPGQEATRSGWFECSCCPTNLVRLLPAVPGYMYAQRDDKLYVNLFINSSATLAVAGKQVKLLQQHNYPWQGDLKFTVSPAAPLNFSLVVRIPGWANDEAIPSELYRFAQNTAQHFVISVNGNPVEYTMDKGYAVIKRQWKKNDVVELRLPMDVKKVMASDKLPMNTGKFAIQRGPLLYCAEWVDNGGKASNILLPERTVFNTQYNAHLLNGVTVIKAQVPFVLFDENGEGMRTDQKTLTSIPYYAWANRGKGEMVVWFPKKVRDIQLVAADK